MTVESGLIALEAVSEKLGATLERRRIREAIEALPVANTDEIDYRRRVLAAIEPVTTPATGPSYPGSFSLNDFDLGPVSAAAAALNAKARG